MFQFTVGTFKTKQKKLIIIAYFDEKDKGKLKKSKKGDNVQKNLLFFRQKSTPEESEVLFYIKYSSFAQRFLKCQCELTFRMMVRTASHACQQKHPLRSFRCIAVSILVVIVDDFPNAALNNRLCAFVAGEQRDIQTATLQAAGAAV